MYLNQKEYRMNTQDKIYCLQTTSIQNKKKEIVVVILRKKQFISIAKFTTNTKTH